MAQHNFGAESFTLPHQATGNTAAVLEYIEGGGPRPHRRDEATGLPLYDIECLRTVTNAFDGTRKTEGYAVRVPSATEPAFTAGHVSFTDLRVTLNFRVRDGRPYEGVCWTASAFEVPSTRRVAE